MWPLGWQYAEVSPYAGLCLKQLVWLGETWCISIAFEDLGKNKQTNKWNA